MLPYPKKTRVLPKYFKESKRKIKQRIEVMKFKITGLEIESDKIISEVYLNITYKDNEKQEIEITDEFEDQTYQDEQILKGSAIKGNF